MRPIGRRGWSDERRLEEELRAGRPRPSDDLVRRLAAELRGVRRRRLPTPRLVLAAVVSSVTLVALGSVGGISGAFAAAGSAASSVAKAAGNGNSSQNKVAICHATGSSSNPYETIVVDNSSTFEGHAGHAGDLIPAPSGGCPSAPPSGGGSSGGNGGATASSTSGKVDICHATSSAENPFVSISVSADGLDGHGDHPDDIDPAPSSGCPKGEAKDKGKVYVCHATGDADHPYDKLKVDATTHDGHDAHADDLIPMPEGGCPKKPKEKVYICHATGSETNPYVRLKVDANGLEGHGDHPDDIIPAPPGGCPDGDTPGEDQYKPGKGCGDKNHVHFKEGKCKEKKEKKEK